MRSVWLLAIGVVAASSSAKDAVRKYALGSEYEILKDVRPAGFREGMRVRIKERNGLYNTKVTGHSADIFGGPGQEGEIVAFASLRGAPLERAFAIVRWDAQTWEEFFRPIDRMDEGRRYSPEELAQIQAQPGKSVRLGSFEAPMHPSSLQPMGAADSAAVAEAAKKAQAAARSLGPPRHLLCEPDHQPVEDVKLLSLRRGFGAEEVAAELAKNPGVEVTRVRPPSDLSVKLSAQALKAVLADTRVESVQDNCTTYRH